MAIAPVKQVNKTRVSQKAKKLVNPATNTLANFAKNPPQLPPVTPLNAQQLAAQQQALGAIPGVSTIAQGAAGATNFLTNPDILSAGSNPYLQSYVDAAIRPVTEGFTTSVLPNIRGEAINNSGVGGSRQALAESLASGKYLRQVGDTASNILSPAYGQGLNAMIQGVNLAPGTAGLQLAPSSITGAVGQQNYDQAALARANGITNQFLPFITAQDVLGSANAIPGATQGVTKVTGAPTTKPPSTAQSALGGAATGAGIGSMFGPWGMAAGAGLGALYGVFA